MIFVAIEDECARDLLKGQSRHTDAPFEYIDMSVKEAYTEDWKTKSVHAYPAIPWCDRTNSKNSLSSSGQKWEIACAQEEGVPVLGIWAYSDDRTSAVSVTTKAWGWETIANFIDGL